MWSDSTYFRPNQKSPCVANEPKVNIGFIVDETALESVTKLLFKHHKHCPCLKVGSCDEKNVGFVTLSMLSFWIFRLLHPYLVEFHSLIC